jgi:uncharacterized membrane protein
MKKVKVIIGIIATFLVSAAISYLFFYTNGLEKRINTLEQNQITRQKLVETIDTVLTEIYD